jgi:hypothetical protein
MCVDFRTLSKSNLIGRGGALYPPFGGTEAAPRGMAGSELSAPPVRSRSHRQIPRGNRRLLALGQRRNRHISSVHFAATFSINISLSPQDYRGFWNLPADYPMVAPPCSELRPAIDKTPPPLGNTFVKAVTTTLSGGKAKIDFPSWFTCPCRDQSRTAAPIRSLCPPIGVMGPNCHPAYDRAKVPSQRPGVAGSCFVRSMRLETCLTDSPVPQEWFYSSLMPAVSRPD